MNLPATLPRVVIISQMMNLRGKTNIGGAYTVYLEGGFWFMKDEHSLFPSRELNLIEMYEMVDSESNYNLTRFGSAIKADPRWRTLYDKAKFDNIDQWDETGDTMREVTETHERLKKELEQTK
jgi:hypothetical protein